MKTGTFHQRLAAARAEREKVLAARGDATEPQFLPGPKPWERPEYLRGEPGKTKDETAARPRLAKPETVEVALAKVGEARVAPASGHATTSRTVVRNARPRPAIALVPVAAQPETVPAAAPPVTVAPLVAAQATGAWRIRLFQLAGGVAFGVSLGVGMGYWFASTPRTQPTAPASVSAEGPAVAAPGESAGEIAGIALPAPEVLPPSPDAPHLSNVTYVSAALPAITGGGPVGPQMATAPAAVTASLALPEAIPPATPSAATAPAPERTAGPGLAATAPELGFDGPAAPLPVAFALAASVLPQVASDAVPPLPVLPEILATPVSYSLPEAVDPGAGPGDT
ncbi:MAG: hypothetical protein ACRCS0_09780, partial [Albidovulum sp.]